MVLVLKVSKEQPGPPELKVLKVPPPVCPVPKVRRVPRVRVSPVPKARPEQLVFKVPRVLPVRPVPKV